MMLALSLTIPFFILLSNAAALPVELMERASITALTAAQISTYKPFTYFAGTAYCAPAKTLAWSCGSNCAANSDFIPTASGGDGSSVQFWYVGYSPSLASVIVGHQGTDTSKIQAIATDLAATQKNFDSTLFPGLSTSIKGHSGFVNAQAKTATAILAAVKSTISATKATKVTIVGHSLGAAISLIDGVYLGLNLSGVSIKVIGYGMPRVGNQAFANYVDSKVPTVHINNKEDIVPIVPGRGLGYVHPAGEIHISTTTSQWLSCPGQDNTDAQCTVGDVTNIFDGNTADHKGPYDGVNITCD